MLKMQEDSYILHSSSTEKNQPGKLSPMQNISKTAACHFRSAYQKVMVRNAASVYARFYHVHVFTAAQ
jgi:hypothetical protein